jgi:hypothetical protein
MASDPTGPLALVGAAVAIVVSIVTRLQVAQEHKATHGEVLSAERAVHRLLERTEHRRRTFRVIQYHLGGYEDDELRKLLIRAGAVRFQDDVETWGLISRNENALDDELFTRHF